MTWGCHTSLESPFWRRCQCIPFWLGSILVTWIMDSSNIRDILTSFSPSLDFCAITSGDGRIKIWDTLKGQLQTEFVDITSTDGTVLQTKSRSGHLSADYTCMKWMNLQVKKRKKAGLPLLILGTGTGDLLAVDVSLGQLKWRVNDCHPGGVNAISFSRTSGIYSAGADGMVCQIDGATGDLLGKFKSSTKAISCISVSSDGKILATAASQLKVFSISDFKSMQKFSGHPASVRCMTFMGDGKYVLSSAVGERYVAVWKIDGGKKQHACCVLSMDHPAVSLDTKGTESEDSDVGLFVLAITELGISYVWFGRNIEELRKTRPTKISLSFEGPILKGHNSLPKIFAGRLQDIAKPADEEVFVAYGSLIKPKFEKLHLQYGKDIVLSNSQDGVLLPKHQTFDDQKVQFFQTEVIALDRANAEDAILPIPKLYNFNDKKRKQCMQNTSADVDEVMVDVGVHGKEKTRMLKVEDDREKVEEDSVSMEDRLRSLGILDKKDDSSRERQRRTPNGSAPNSTTASDAQLLIEANLAPKKMKSTISCMRGTDAYKLLKALVAMWKSRSARGEDVLPLICIILVKHSHTILSQESSSQLVDALFEMTTSKGAAFQPLLKLSGRLQLIRAQIDKAGQHIVQAVSGDSEVDEIEDEDEEEEEVDEFVYGEEEDDMLQSLSDDGDL